MYVYHMDVGCLAENVNRRTSFMDAAQQEKMREREALESGLMFSRDRLIEMIPVISCFILISLTFLFLLVNLVAIGTN